MAESKIFGKLKGKLAALKKKEIIIALVAVAVMLLIYFSSLPRGDTAAATATETDDDYCAAMETKVREAAVGMSGDRNVRVILRWESGVESIVASATSSGQSTSSASPVITGGKPLVLKQIYPRALGAAIVVKGGENVKLKLDLINMVSTLLGLSPENIAVFGSK